MRLGSSRGTRKECYEPRFALRKNSSAASRAGGAQGKGACFMDSVRRDSTVPFAEIKPGREGFLPRSAAPPYAETKPEGARAGAIVYQDTDEWLTFESAPERFGRFRCVETFEKNRLHEVL